MMNSIKANRRNKTAAIPSITATARSNDDPAPVISDMLQALVRVSLMGARSNDYENTLASLTMLSHKGGLTGRHDNDENENDDAGNQAHAHLHVLRDKSA